MAATDPDVVALLPLPPAFLHILIAIGDEDRHGYAIMQDVADRTEGRVRMSPGTLYGSIRRMLDEGLIEERFPHAATGDDDERRRYYRVTQVRPRGRGCRDRSAVHAGASGARERARAAQVVICDARTLNASSASCCGSIRSSSGSASAATWRPRIASPGATRRAADAPA